jgi:ATP-dependent DNA helicase RecQ
MDNREDLITQSAQNLFHINYLFPFQRLVITDILEAEEEEKDVKLLVLLPTGSGKSLCFLLPSQHVRGKTLLIYPLRSLQRDQERRLSAAHISYASFHGGMEKAEEKKERAKLTTSQTKIIITNPETLAKPGFLIFLRNYPISLAVVDEAHVIDKWGLTFRPSYIQLGEILHSLHCREILAFSATADQETKQTLFTYLFHTSKVSIIQGSCDRKNISYFTLRTFVKQRSLSLIVHKAQARPAIVFCKTRKETEEAYTHFKERTQIPCSFYHAGLEEEEKLAREQWFNDSNDGVLFATCAYGMGIDKKNIRTTIHRTLCPDALAFLQESGRAGRDGKESTSYILLGPEEIDRVHNHDPLATLFFRNSCYRKSLCLSLGEEMHTCSGCSICNGTLHTHFDGAQVVIQLIQWAPFHFTIHSAAMLLQGKDGNKMGNAHYGILSSWQLSEITVLITELIHFHILKSIRQRLFYSRKGFQSLKKLLALSQSENKRTAQPETKEEISV